MEQSVKELILSEMPERIAVPVEIKGEAAYLPDQQITVTVEVLRAVENMVSVLLTAQHPLWDREIAETYTGMGGDIRDALETAMGSFYLAFMPCLLDMMASAAPQEMDSQFLGKEHRWDVYPSLVVSVSHGDEEEQAGGELWHLVKDHVSAYLGNQKVVYMRGFAAKTGDNLVCEWRVNNVVIPELSALLEPYAESLGETVYRSVKQNVLLRQQEQTADPYPFTQQEIGGFVRQAIPLFTRYLSDSQYAPDQLHMALIDEFGELTGDDSLALELYSFLPEIAAELLFSQVAFDERVVMIVGETETQLMRSQLASFYPMVFALEEYLLFDEENQEQVQMLALQSGTVSALNQAVNDASEFEGMQVTSSYQFDPDYQIR